MRYHSIVADSARWDGFELRPGDIVISTPPKCGTTWTQMLVALLVFDGPEFPGPLDQVSPWLDMCNRTVEDVHGALAAQTHRRFIKTHTPLDGLPVRGDVTYVVVGRDPRDVVISFEHHFRNMDRDHFFELRAERVGLDDLQGLDLPDPPSKDPAERFRTFVETPGLMGTPTLAMILHHMDTAWARRHDGNVVMCHYADYKADLPGELQRLARALDIDLTEERAVELAAEAELDRMRARAAEVAPSVTEGNWKDNAAFFRVGALGEWREHLTPDDLARYDERVSALVADDLAAWVHEGRLGSGVDPTPA